MKYKNVIFEITLSGLLVALAIALSFATFKIGAGSVYLVGVAVFIMPLVLRLPYALISGVTSVVIADALTGWIMFTWISVLVYGLAIVIIWLFKLIKLRWVFVVGLVVAAGISVLLYYLLELIAFDKAIATADAIATVIQFAIVVPIVSMLYLPLKFIIKSRF